MTSVTVVPTIRSYRFRLSQLTVISLVRVLPDPALGLVCINGNQGVAVNDAANLSGEVCSRDKRGSRGAARACGIGVDARNGVGDGPALGPLRGEQTPCLRLGAA